MGNHAGQLHRVVSAKRERATKPIALGRKNHLFAGSGGVLSINKDVQRRDAYNCFDAMRFRDFGIEAPIREATVPAMAQSHPR